MLEVLAAVQPRGEGRLLAGSLADDIQAEGVEGAGDDLIGGQPQGRQALADPRLQFPCGVRVEGQQQDATGGYQAALQRVAGFGHQGGGLP
ncbi:hypothetical protein D3C78_585030 [compost metagenome]